MMLHCTSSLLPKDVQAGRDRRAALRLLTDALE